MGEYMSQKILISFVVSTLFWQISCGVSNYTTEQEFYENSTCRTDTFSKTRTITGPKHFYDEGWGHFMLRSVVGTNYAIGFHQIYVSDTGRDWRFFRSAVSSSGQDAAFVNIDTDINADFSSAASSISCTEVFGIMVTEALSKAFEGGTGLRYRVYGRRGTRDIDVPKEYVAGYMRFYREQTQRFEAGGSK
jgi:hypothetical protein